MEERPPLSRAETELADLVRLVATGSPEDVRLFIARLVRLYQGVNPALCLQLSTSLDELRRRTGFQSVMTRDAGDASD